MAYSLNRAQLIGNLTRDPEVKQTPSGVTVATFGIATNFSWTDKSGQQQDKTDFHNVVVWRKLADICGQYLKKGMKIYIEGKMQTRDWEGEDGVKRYRTEIVADNMIMLGSKKDGASAGASTGAPAYNNEGANASNNAGQKPAASAAVADEVPLDDLPF